MEKKIKCLNCGAEFGREHAKCPYCNTIYEWGAEEKYMQELEGIKEELAEIPEQVEEAYKKETFAAWKKILIIVGAAAVLVGIGAGIFAGVRKMSKRFYEEDIKASLLWEKEYFPKMDEWYSEGNYDAILELMHEHYEDEGYAVWEWEHYYFINAYESYLDFMDSVDYMTNEETANRKTSQYMVGSAIHFVFFLKKANYTAEEWEMIQVWQAQVEEVLYEEMKFTEEEVKELYEKINDDGYIDYDECDKYTSKIWKRFIR